MSPKATFRTQSTAIETKMLPPAMEHEQTRRDPGDEKPGPDAQAGRHRLDVRDGLIPRDPRQGEEGGPHIE